MSSRGTEGGLLQEIALALEPIGEAARQAALGNERPLEELLEDAGLDETALGSAYPAIERRIQRLGDAWETIDRVIVQPMKRDEKPDFEDIDEVFRALGTMFEVLMSLDEITVPKPDVDRVGELLVDYLLITYLADHHVVVYCILSVLGVIRAEGPGTVGDLQLSRLDTALADPNAAIQSGFEWGTHDFEPYLVLFYVRGIIEGFGIDAEFRPVTREMKTEIQGLGPNEPWPGLKRSASETDGSEPGTTGEDGPGTTEEGIDPTGPAADLADERLEIDVLSLGSGALSGSLGINVIPVPGKHGNLPGLAIMPFGIVGGKMHEDLGNHWTFNASFTGEADWALRIRPSGVDTVPDSGVDADVHGEASLTFDPPEDPESTTVIGNEDGTGVGIKYFQARAVVDYDDDGLTLVVEMPVRGSMEAQPTDGFLKSVMPEGVQYDFDGSIGWSSESGLYFERGGTLSASIPLAKRFGPLLIEEFFGEIDPTTGGGGRGTGGGPDSADGAKGARTGSAGASASGIDADVDPGTGTITITAAASVSVRLGPVTARVDRLGVEATQSSGQDISGAVDVDVKPPLGVGISLDKGAVSGGGYLRYEPEKNRYAGTVQIKTEDLTINAVGLLTTDLPGSEDGFSLLLLATGDFPPIQLGYGFTLNGLGGLIGINRSVRTRRLGSRVQQGSIGPLLFPENPVANAERIVSDLRTIFPPTKGRHVIGPMARIGWGTPSFLTADIGAVLEIPTAEIGLIGRMQAALPDEKIGLIELNLAVSGYLDPPSRRIAIDANLYQSRVAGFALHGDMALRASYGDDPRFLLSVGGWHPRYDPPSGFPDIERVRATLGKPEGNPRVELGGYFALTANTVQVGARAYAVLTAGPAKAKGHVSFDTLFRFSPFKFVFDFDIAVRVSVFGKGLSVDVSGTIMGPGPYRVDGTVDIDLFGIHISPRIDVALGPSRGREEFPTAKVLPELVDELNKPGNWRAQRPADGGSRVTIRDVETGANEVLAHPLGEIGVRQTVVPLAFRIERFDNAVPAGYDRFDVAGVAVDGSGSISLDAPALEEFAPAKYLEMSNSEKLNAPTFESHPAGRIMRHDGVYCGYPDGDRPRNSRTARYRFESSVVDGSMDNWGTSLDQLGRFASEGLDAESGLSDAHLRGLSSVRSTEIRGPDATGSDRSRADERDGGEGKATPGQNDAARTGERSDAAADEWSPDRAGTPDVGGLSGPVSMGDRAYTVVDATDLSEVSLPELSDVDAPSKAQAMGALERARERRPEAAGDLRVVPARRAVERDGERTRGDRPADDRSGGEGA